MLSPKNVPDLLYVVYPGESAYPLENRIEVVPISELKRVIIENKLAKR